MLFTTRATPGSFFTTRSVRELFDQLGRRSEKVLILSEGLLLYFTPEEAGALAADLKAPASFNRWILDLASPGLLQLLRMTLTPKAFANSSPGLLQPWEPSFLKAFQL
jgi:O-methyltransferase involved in polyketide biosynthesis